MIWNDFEDVTDPDASTLIEATEVYDYEEPIKALRRNYVLARMGGWDQIAATRIAMRNVEAILNAGTPKTQAGNREVIVFESPEDRTHERVPRGNRRPISHDGR